MADAHDILDETESLRERVEEYLRPVADWFHDHEGELFKRAEARAELSEELDIAESHVDDVLAHLVSDTVDPVVQIPTRNTAYVGVVEFHEFDGGYGYVTYDDHYGKAKRVVCQQCVNEKEKDENVVHATAGQGSISEDTDYDDLLTAIHDHYRDTHDTRPEAVETGASLASGTTINTNTAYHSGIGLQANLNANSYNISNVGAFDATSVNTDGGTIGNDPILGGPSTSTDVSGTVGIGTGWNVVNTNNPIILATRLVAETDGSTQGDIRLLIDESGGSTSDYIIARGRADDEMGATVSSSDTSHTYIPAGASVKIDNVSDPNNNNRVAYAREYEL